MSGGRLSEEYICSYIHVWKSSMPIREIISIMDCFPECNYPEVVVQVKLPGVSVRGRG